jgi:leader peptidase (prepilin peptidase)/N-methyltransferase
MNTIWFLPLILLLGLISGQIINYFTDTLPRTRKISLPFCVQCETTTSVVDFLLLRPCKECGNTRNKRSWIVLFVTAVIFCLLWILTPVKLGFWASAVIFTYFAIVFIMDLEFRVIVYPLTIFGYLLAIPYGIFIHGWREALIGGAAGFGIMTVLYLLGIGFIKILSKARNMEISEVALGFGDVTLSGILGFLLGWPLISASLFASIVLGGLFSLMMIIIHSLRKDYSPLTAIPYAPFLLVGAAVLLAMLS